MKIRNINLGEILSNITCKRKEKKGIIAKEEIESTLESKPEEEKMEPALESKPEEEKMEPALEIELEDGNIKYDDAILKVNIGKWLGLLRNAKVYSGAGIQLVLSLSTEEIVEKGAITPEQSKEISNEFMRLLNSIGIAENETIKISRIDENNNTFKCHFNESNKDIVITLIPDTWDSPKRIKICIDNESKTYNYWEPYEERKGSLHLNSYDTYYPETENSIHRYPSPYSYIMDMSNGNLNLSLRISPNDRPYGSENYKIREDGEEYDKDLEREISKLTIPVDSKKILEILLSYSEDCINNVKGIYIKTTKDLENDRKKVIESANIENGKLNSYTTTIKDENGTEKTVSFDSNGNWSVNSNKVIIQYLNEESGKITYSLNKFEYGLLSDMNSIDKQVSEAEKLVGRVKKDLEEFISKRTNNKVKVKARKEVTTNTTS